MPIDTPKHLLGAIGFILLGLVTACTTGVETPTGEGASGLQVTPTARPTLASIPEPGKPGSQVQIPDYDPVFGFDAIPPIYEPEFSQAATDLLKDEELVIGTALGGQAKAYPITVLRFREMVNDELGGIPILVTW